MKKKNNVSKSFRIPLPKQTEIIFKDKKKNSSKLKCRNKNIIHIKDE